MTARPVVTSLITVVLALAKTPRRADRDPGLGIHAAVPFVIGGCGTKCPGRCCNICHMRTAMVNLGKNGRLVIPAPFRRALEIEPGDELVLTLEDRELRITTRQHAVERAQEAVRRRVRGQTSLVEELIADRRAEADRE